MEITIFAILFLALIAAVTACALMTRLIIRERRMCGGMVASCREHRADCKRFATEARSAAELATSATILPFNRDV